MLNLHPPTAGTLAQLVEQRTENPCVPGSIPGGTTAKTPKLLWGFFCFSSLQSLPLHQMNEAVLIYDGSAEHDAAQAIEEDAVGVELPIEAVAIPNGNTGLIF